MTDSTQLGPRRATARVLIVDDHALVREGMRQLIERHAGLSVSGEAASAHEALAAIKKDLPDLATIDITLPGVNGIELIKRIRAQWPEIKILVTSMHEERVFARRALRAGASGYIEKGRGIQELRTAIERVLGGEIYVSSEMMQQMLQDSAGRSESEESGVASLSDRELEVFALFGQGETPRKIAGQLNLSVKTIDTYRERIKTKLGLESSNELVRRAAEWNLGHPQLVDES